MKKKAASSQSYKGRINWVDEFKPVSREKFYRDIEIARRKRKKEMGTTAEKKKLVLKRNYGKLSGKGRVIRTIIK